MLAFDLMMVLNIIKDEDFFREYLKSLKLEDFGCFTERISHFIYVNESRK